MIRTMARLTALRYERHSGQRFPIGGTTSACPHLGQFPRAIDHCSRMPTVVNPIQSGMALHSQGLGTWGIKMSKAVMLRVVSDPQATPPKIRMPEVNSSDSGPDVGTGDDLDLDMGN